MVEDLVDDVDDDGVASIDFVFPTLFPKIRLYTLIVGAFLLIPDDDDDVDCGLCLLLLLLLPPLLSCLSLLLCGAGVAVEISIGPDFFFFKLLASDVDDDEEDDDDDDEDADDDDEDDDVGVVGVADGAADVDFDDVDCERGEEDLDSFCDEDDDGLPTDEVDAGRTSLLLSTPLLLLLETGLSSSLAGSCD
jgi:hypothetical protein